MTDVWLTIAVLVAGTAVIRGAGPFLVGGRELSPRFQGVIALLAPALLAALVVVQTMSAPEGADYELDGPRIAGVLAAAGMIVARAPMLPVIATAATVTAFARLLL